MIIFGIDPGVSGAICVLKEGKILEVYEMPTMIDGKKNKRQVNGAEVTNIFLKELNNKYKAKVVVEHVTAMPGQGVTSMFNFGQSFGVLKGICAALKLPIYFVRPVKWKKHFNLIKTNKDASRTKVIEIFPYISSKISRKKDSNKADSILIGKYFEETQNT
ncbi:MAG TPA: crossover junction endodeoxyribonuclease [Pelagibacteraceae bacterium]|jgi:crossover junction endodeoxyribonuclease RuvC|nr:crossover junction endodeoxyribonuclease [Candidatus Pelagibacter sp.]MBO6490037.1 crossover junction endodeoxyribonuclease [Pelagibacteraceae bacterium]MBO6491309.1 crossover junction endodeoxyribonuclease [Pelagibacteraceae bacterium]MBO6493284.1 crossover junction endodeoxyribonuclease [Pelagibacteraceae bacterium]MDP6440721.1 crossover junction endodeoxyribonuclease [Pelagibacteraceae bacterium]|tara:strand:+ start:6288 stop:6770 length:483 start_codon:yes stop_codon:yes gene_type:complete